MTNDTQHERNPDVGHPLLQRLIDSICIIDGNPCWDYAVMYDLRDYLAARQHERSLATQPTEPVYVTNDEIDRWSTVMMKDYGAPYSALRDFAHTVIGADRVARIAALATKPESTPKATPAGWVHPEALTGIKGEIDGAVYVHSDDTKEPGDVPIFLGAQPQPTPVSQGEVVAVVSEVVGAGPNDVGIRWRGGIVSVGTKLYTSPVGEAAPQQTTQEAKP